MKIIILTSAHPTDDVRVMTKIAGGFCDLGHEVVWCGPDTSFFDSDRDPRITWSLAEHQGGWRGRLRNLTRSARSAAQHKDADWIYTPDPDAALAALAVSKRNGARTLFDIHEDFHNGLLRRSIKNETLAALAGRAVKAILSWTARRSDLTIAVSPVLLDLYTSPKSDRLAVLNTAPARFSSLERPQFPRERPLRVIHGKAMRGNGTPAVIQAVEQLTDQSGVEVVFIVSGGPGASPFDAEIADRLHQEDLASRVVCLEGVPHREMPDLLQSCDVGLISYGRVLGEASLPNRLFEYMAAGVAVLAPNYSPEIVKILEENSCGVTADFENSQDVAEKIQQLSGDPSAVKEMGAAGRVAFREKFAWEAQRDRLSDLMESKL